MIVRRAGDGAGIRFVDLPAAAGVAIRKLRRAAKGPPGRQQRAALRIPLGARARIVSAGGWSDCPIGDASLTGVLVIFPAAPTAEIGDPVIIDVPQVGMLTARVARTPKNGLGLAFEDASDEARDHLIRYLYAVPRRITVSEAPRAATLFHILAKRLFGPDLVQPVHHSEPK